ncbi:PAS domain S-box protein [Gaetbulibacter aestuarii]|uniref:histidine kinase n=1 Tax=Gaetbulibacter aestuarii TaxID=1502358 RepID=A0ABW7MW45_9FLAO
MTTIAPSIAETLNVLKSALNVPKKNIFYHGISDTCTKEPVTSENYKLVNKLLTVVEKEQKIMLCNDLSQDNRFKSDYKSKGSIQAFIGLPLLGLGERAIGIFYILFDHKTKYPKNTESLLLAITKQAGLARRNEMRLKNLEKENRIVYNEIRKRKKILEATQAGSWFWDIENQELTITPRWAEIIGYTVEELEPVNYEMWANLVYPKDLKMAEKAIQSCFSKEVNFYNVTFRMIHKKGHYVWVNSSGLITDWSNTGEPLYMVGSHIDVSLQKKSEEILKRNKWHLEEVQRITNIGSWSYDVVAKEFLFSEGFSAQLKYSKNQSFEDVMEDVMEEDKSIVCKARSACIKSGKPFEINYRIQTPNDTVLYIEEHGFAIKDENGNVVNIYGTLHDVTEKKKEQQHLKLLESVITNTNDTVIITEPDPFNNPGPRIIFVNEAFTKMTGYSPDEVIGKSPRILEGPKTDQKELEKLGEALKNLESYEVTTINYKKNGEEFWNNFTVTPVIDDEGKCTHWISIERDVTKKKKEQQHLKLLESVITNTTDTVIITEAEPFEDPGPKIIYANEAFTKMTGYSVDEIIGKSPRILQGPKSDFEALSKLGKALRNWETHEVTTINYKKNGEEFWCNFTVTPVADETGWYTHWIAIERDVTEQVNKINSQRLLNEISGIFTEEETVKGALQGSLDKILKLTELSYGEIWSPNWATNELTLMANNYTDTEGKAFKKLNSKFVFDLDEGVQSKILEKKEYQFLTDIQNNPNFDRRETAKIARLNTAIGFPLVSHDEAVGILMLASREKLKNSSISKPLFKELEGFLGREIKRKSLEVEFNDAFNITPDMLTISDGRNYFTRVNPAATKILGYSEKELLSQSFFNFVHPDDRDITIDQTDILSSGNPVYNFENRYITKEGKIVWLSWAATPSFSNGLTYSVAKDVTERKKTQAKLNALNLDLKKHTYELEQKNKKLQKIAWTQSHQLRAPLARILGIIESIDLIKREQKMTEEEILLHESLKESGMELDRMIKKVVKKTDF